MESSFSQIEAQALRLTPEERARLAGALFESTSDEGFADTVEIWAARENHGPVEDFSRSHGRRAEKECFVGHAAPGRTSEAGPGPGEGGFIPQTALVKKLLKLRQKAIANGMKLLSEEEALEEVARRRGEIQGDEADVY